MLNLKRFKNFCFNIIIRYILIFVSIFLFCKYNNNVLLSIYLILATIIICIVKNNNKDIKSNKMKINILYDIDFIITCTTCTVFLIFALMELISSNLYLFYLLVFIIYLLYTLELMFFLARKTGISIIQIFILLIFTIAIGFLNEYNWEKTSTYFLILFLIIRPLNEKESYRLFNVKDEKQGDLSGILYNLFMDIDYILASLYLSILFINRTSMKFLLKNLISTDDKLLYEYIGNIYIGIGRFVAMTLLFLIMGIIISLIANRKNINKQSIYELSFGDRCIRSFKWLKDNIWEFAW